MPNKLDSLHSSRKLLAFAHEQEAFFYLSGLNCNRYRVNTFTIPTTDILDLITSAKPNCVLIDYQLQGNNGLQIINEIMLIHPYLAVIMVTDHGDENIAVQAIKSGAENYFVKSKVTAKKLDEAIEKAITAKAIQKKDNLRIRALKQNESKLVEKEKELEHTLKFQNLMIESIPEYFFVKNHKFELVAFNSAFKNLYPQDLQEKILGTTTVESYPQEEVDKFLEMDKLALESGYSETYETITFPSGKLRTLLTTKTHFKNSTGEDFILGISRDVTEKELLIQKLTKSNQDLEQFAYIASHDLKSPLNAIVKLVGWIHDDNEGSFDEDTRHNFKLIKNRAKRMTSLLDDLLDYSRISKKCDFPEHVDLTDMKNTIVDLVNQPKELILNFPPLTLFIPKLAFQLVLMNLVSNSIKHTNSSFVEVNLSVDNRTAGYVFIISDNGPGIDYNYATRIFEMFETLKPRDEIEGSGMGLAMTKKIIEHYGGYIKLLDAPIGASFEIFWPNIQSPNSEDNNE